MKGPDLTTLFLEELRDRGLNIQELESRSGKTVYARLASEICYLRYANRSVADSFYFGFSTKDINKMGFAVKAKKAILICGHNKLSDDIFALDFDYFVSLIKKGIPVSKNHADYEEYQATIYPKRNYIMKVTNSHGREVEMNIYRTALADLCDNLNTSNKSSSIRIFHNSIQKDAHEQFDIWRSQFPNGFVAQFVKSNEAIIHIALCDHFSDIGYPSEYGDLGKRRKVCSTTIKELNHWAQNEGVILHSCKTCQSQENNEAVKALDTTEASVSPQREPIAAPPELHETTTDRISRDSAVVQQVKTLYQNQCQICGYFIELPDGSRYSEAHHIVPLGGQHQGHDVLANLLCVCPNHHIELDYGCRPLIITDLKLHPSHHHISDNIDYHNSKCYKKAPNKVVR